MIVVAIDPGTRESAYLAFDGTRVLEHATEANERVLMRIAEGWAPTPAAIVLEQIESFGMAVGREVFETVFVTGRFYEAALRFGPMVPQRMTRKTVKVHLCQSIRAQDSNIRAALIDRFGGTRESAIGVKKAPGPLFGVKGHEYAALAIAVTWWDQCAAEFTAASQQLRPGVKAEWSEETRHV